MMGGLTEDSINLNLMSLQCDNLSGELQDQWSSSLWLYRSVCVRPGRKPKLLVLSRTGSFIFISLLSHEAIRFGIKFNYHVVLKLSLSKVWPTSLQFVSFCSQSLLIV